MTNTVETTVAERARHVAEGIHSAEMEGLSLSPAMLADAELYIAGHIDADQLVERTRQRYGLGAVETKEDRA